MRLHKVIENVVDNDQKGYIKGRFAGENVRLINDILYYTAEEQIEGAILSLDFRKAFDSVNRDFMFKVRLKKFNFGESFLKWVNTIYSKSECVIVNNGWISESFEMECGIRQGCPLSALLFILVVDIMACNIRKDKCYKGISLPNNDNGEEVRIAQLADDTVLFVGNEKKYRDWFKHC
ncbi:uncharacterized protein [Antedon mediterranea]|uniref:uncharacterized protein n=1 Tax=Antedon mediterranea TaxID=105859 RepID=UPI003AF54EC0